MDDRIGQFAKRLQTAIHALRRAIRRALLTRGAAAVVLAIVGFASLQLVLDRSFQLSVDQRVILNILITFVWAWVVYRYLLRPILQPISDSRVASWVDRANPALHDLTKTAVEFGATQRVPRGSSAVSDDLVALAMNEAQVRLDQAAFDRVLNRRQLTRSWQLLIGGVVVSILPWLIFPSLMNIWFSRNWLLQDVAWPQKTYIEPQDFDATNRRRMARGDAVSIEAVVRGEMPRLATLHWQTQDGQTGKQNMIRTGDDRLIADLGILTKELEFRIIGNDERTKPFVLVPVERPRITDSVVRIIPPAYVGDEDQVYERQANVELLAGSKIEFVVGLNKPVMEARLLDAKGEAVGTTDFARDRESAQPRVSTVWDEPQSGTYAYSLTDHDGIANLNPVRFVLRVKPDEAPTVELAALGASDVITPIADIPVRMLVSDSFGISSAALTAQRNTQAPQTVLAPQIESRKRRLEETGNVVVQKMEVDPGDTLWLQSTAHDNDPRGPNIGSSRNLSFRVLSLDDFRLVMAQREQELRSEFERLLANQRSLKIELTQIIEAIGTNQIPEPREVRRLEALSRKQSSYGTRCGTFAERYEEMIDEMRVNRVGRVADERRVSLRIAGPLQKLRAETIPAAATQIRALSQSATDENRIRSADLQDRTLREMLFVFQNMLEGEGYREVLSTLQEIIGEQESIQRDTEAKVSSLLDDILGLSDPKPEDTRDTPPPIE